MVKNTPVGAEDARDAGLIPGLGRSPEGENGNPLQYSCLENPMDRGAWWATVRGVAESWTRLCMHPHKLLRTVSPLPPIFSPSGRDTHTPSRSHTHPHSLTRGLSQSLHCAAQQAHPLSITHTLTHHFCCVLCRSASTRMKKNFSASGSSKMVCGTKRDPSVMAT